MMIAIVLLLGWGYSSQAQITAAEDLRSKTFDMLTVIELFELFRHQF